MPLFDVYAACSRCGKMLDTEVLMNEGTPETAEIGCSVCEAPFVVVTMEETKRVKVETLGELRKEMLDPKARRGVWH